MGWLDVLDIGLGVTNLAVNVTNANTLEQLRAQGAAATIVQGVIKELRDQIFRYKQTAETILESESKSPPKVSAGAMKLLELRLHNSGITPELFQELADKDYAAATIRTIHDSGNRLMEQLSSEEQAQVGEMLPAALRLPDYNFYVASYDDVQRYRKFFPTYKELRARQLNSCLFVALILITLNVCVLGGGFILGSLLGDASFLGWPVSFLLWAAALFFYLNKVRRGQEFTVAKSVVEEVQNKINLRRFAELEKEFGTEKDKVILGQQHARKLVQDFFGDESLPSFS